MFLQSWSCQRNKLTSGVPKIWPSNLTFQCRKPFQSQLDEDFSLPFSPFFLECRELKVLSCDNRFFFRRIGTKKMELKRYCIYIYYPRKNQREGIWERKREEVFIIWSVTFLSIMKQYFKTEQFFSCERENKFFQLWKKRERERERQELKWQTSKT